MRMLIATIVLGLGIHLGVASVVFAESHRVSLTTEGVEQKSHYIKNLVNSSSAAESIEDSGDVDALAALATARQLVAGAQAELASGHLEEANSMLDKALNLVNVEVRRLSQPELKEKRDKELYERRHSTVNVFLDAYERVSTDANDRRFKERVATIQALMANAEDAASREEYEDARALVDEAYGLTRADIREIRDGDVLTKSLIFASKEEEYAYELDRNQSHFILLQIALKRKPPVGTFAERIDSLEKEARKKREVAEDHAKKEEFESAITALDESTKSLLKAVSMGGIYIPT